MYYKFCIFSKQRIIFLFCFYGIRKKRRAYKFNVHKKLQYFK